MSTRLFGFLFLIGVTTVSEAATYQVGPTRTYHSVGALPALTAGDIVEVDPATYNEVKRWTISGTAAKPIVIRGVGGARPIFDATNQVVDGVLPHPRAVFQVEVNCLQYLGHYQFPQHFSFPIDVWVVAPGKIDSFEAARFFFPCGND